MEFKNNFKIFQAGKVPLYNKPQRRPKFILPTIAPFGTEGILFWFLNVFNKIFVNFSSAVCLHSPLGFTFSPEEEQRRKNLRHRRRQRQRRQRGHRP